MNEASKWDWNISTEVVDTVEETTIVVPTSIPEEHEETEDGDEPLQPKMRSLQDLYDSTSEVHLVCLLADAENISVEEALRDKKWKSAMTKRLEQSNATILGS